MNHIYKVIWNTITQTWVAVSELSRAKGKTKSSKTLSAVVLAAVSAGAIVGGAEAAYIAGVGNGIAISLKGGALPADAKDRWSIAIGTNASAEKGYDIAIGGNSHAKSQDTRDAQGKLLEGAAIAIGKETKATGQGTIAIGRKTLAEGEYGSAYGSQANAHGARSTALGYVASASGNDSLAGGALAESRGEGSVALGKDAQATGDYANAIGSSARATEWATAVGPGTQANGVASAAYGDGSVADGKKAIAMGSHATAKNESTIAIGNGAKVGATNGDVAATNGIAIGTESESKDQQAIAVGKQAIAAGNNSIALGNETTTTGGEGVAIGNTASASNQSVAFGSKAKATAQKGYSSAFGNESVADQADASAIGNTAKALAENATSVGAHSTVDTGATYGSALGRSANVSAANGTALGSSSSVTAADGTAVGTGATVSTAGGVALGQGSKSTRAALDGGSITISSAGNVISSNHITDKDITDKDNSTVNDVYAPVKLIKLINDKSILERVKNTIKGTAGAVSLGNNTTTRQLTNLAPGSADYDAVNVAQLKAVVGTIKHYNVTSKDGDITINPDTTDPNKTVWDLKINPKYKIKYFSVKSEGGANENNDGATATDAIAIGKNASSTGSNAVSLGLGAKALGNNNTAIGAGAQAKDVRTTAVGYNATAEAASAVGIGYEAHATQSRSLAIGQDATASANNAIALGSSGQQSGNDRPNKTTASAEHAVAIGSGAVANIANGIALGSQSKTTAASGQTGFDASQDVEGARVNTYKDLTNNKKNVRTSTLAGLSIGDTDKTRQINHLAAGTADDDAVNVAQLKSVNLAFKGDNNTKGDVRLHDQRLSVVGATGSFITTKANDNKLEISTTQGTFSTTADGKSSPTTAGLATTTAVASAINNSGWEVRAKGTKVGLVNPGDKVDFTNADNSIEIESSAEANGLSTIKFKAVTAKINTEKKHPVEITINNGITTKKIDKTKQATPTGKFVVPTGDDTNKYALATAYDVADKVNQTGWNLYTNGGAPALINPGDYVNFKSGNATNANVVTEASEGATISYDVNVDNTTIKIDPNGNKLTANTGDVDSVTNTEGNSKKGQVTIHKDSLEPSKTDSGKLATVDTVVKAVNNAKWFAKADNNGGEIADDAKTNDADDADGQAMGAGDKLTLKAGKNLRVKRDGANFTFATDNDVTFNKVTSNEFVVNPNGKFTVGSGATINMGDNIIHGVATGVADTDAVNVAQLKANTTTVEAGKNVTVNKTKDDATGKTFTVHSEKATVSKEDNSPIKLTSTSNTSEHTTDYKVGLDIDEGTLEVKNGKLAAKAQVKAIEVVESKEGDDNIAKVNVKSGQNKGDAGATYQVSVTKNDVKDAAKEAVDVRGSDFITVTPTDGEHLKTHTVAAKTGEITVAEATGSVTSIATATGLTTNKAVADAIAKSGFQLKQGEEATAKTVINPGDSLTFKDGQGTKAVVNANGDVTINANVASLTGGDNVTVKDNGNGSFTISATDTNTQASVSKAANSPITINATGADNAKNYELDVAVDGTTISKAGGTLHAETGAIEEVTTTTGDNAKKKGQVQAKPNDENKVATVSNVANAINKAKWFAKADNNGGEIADDAKTNDADDADGQAMGAGDKLTLKAGKNLRVKRDGANFTFATDNDVTFNKVTSNEFVVNPNGKFTVGSGATINMGDNIIHGVATGVADTDAVNVAQLKANTTTVEAGKNVTVNKTKDDATGKTFTVHSEKATVSKEDNSPIKLTSTSNTSEHTTDYKVGLDIDEGTLEVKNGKLAAKAQVKAIEVVESKEGDDNIAKVNVKSGQNKGDAGATYQVSVTKNDVKDAAKEAVDVRGSDFITVTPTDGEHLKTHTVAAKTGEITVAEATGSVTSIATATGLTTNKAVADAIAKSGFQLKQGEEATAKTVINPGDSLTFKDGQGTKAVVNANGDVTINANVASLTGGDNVTVKDNGNGSFTISATDTNTQASVSKAANSPITINATGADNAKNYELDVAVDGTTISKNGGVLSAATTDLNVSNKGGVENITGDDGKKLVNATTVAKIVGDTYWTAKQGEHTEDNTESTNAADSKIKAGDELTFASGKNMALKKDGNKFIYGTKDEVTFTTTNTTNLAVNPNNTQGATFTVGKNTAINMGDNIIHGVSTGVADTDAVNVAQLKSTERHITPTRYTYNDTDKSVTLTYTDGTGKVVPNTEAKIDLSGLASKIKDYSFKTNATGSNLVGTGTDTKVESGKSVDFAASDNLTLKQDVKDGNVTYTYGLKNQVVVGEKGTPGKDGIDGSIGVNGKDGSAVAINGEDGSIGLNGKDGKNGLTIKGQDGKVGVDGKDGETRLVYVEKADPTKPGSSDKTHELATLDDGMKYGGDIGEVANVKLNKQVDIKGGVTDKTKLSDNNIGVISTPNATTGGTELTVKLAKELKGLTSAEFKGGDDNAVTNITNSGITIKPANSNDDSKTVSLTNTGLNNGGNKITHVAEGKDDTDAVNVKQLKDFKSEVAEGGLTFAGNSGTDHKAKLNSTVNIKGAEGNTDANQFDNGKNVMTAVNGNTVTVSIKKTPEVEGINITDTTGNVKVKLTQTNEGLKVSDNNDQATRITNVKAGKKDTDAVNVKQLNAAKTEVTAGDNIDVRSSTGANGQTIYKVSANDTSAAVEAGSDHVKVTKAANTHKDGSTTVTDYTVDLSDKTKGDIGKGVKAYDKVTNEGLTFNADKGSTGVKKLGSKVSVNGDGKNITTTADENGVKVSMKDDIKVNSVTAKEVKVGDVNINENGINAGGKRITNVAPGKDGTDAVNVNQLKYVAGNISNQINNVDKGLRAGIAGALASGGLYHVTTAGKSMVSVGAGTYRGQNALAVGYSRLSDNGKVGVKFTVNSNSQGHSGASASVGYQW